MPPLLDCVGKTALEMLNQFILVWAKEGWGEELTTLESHLHIDRPRGQVQVALKNKLIQNAGDQRRQTGMHRMRKRYYGLWYRRWYRSVYTIPHPGIL